MIKTITLTDVYNGLSAISAITDVVTLYSQKPADDVVAQDSAYCWLSIVSNNKDTPSNIGYMTGTIRLSITIVAPKETEISGNQNESDVLDNIINAITNAIVEESCGKLTALGTTKVMRIVEADQSPLLYTPKNRASKVKDYFITYVSKYE